MIISTKVERIPDKELVRILSRCPASPATDKYLVRPVNYEMLIGTHLPDEEQHRLGALAVSLLKDPAVMDIEIWQTNKGLWVAHAFVEINNRERLRLGEGATPVEAFVNLVYDIQRY